MWVLHGLCAQAVFQGVHAQEWVPGSIATSHSIAALGIPEEEIQGRLSVYNLWDSTTARRERVLTESKVHAQAGRQTVIIVPKGSIKALAAKEGRGSPKLLGTFEGWKWEREEGNNSTATKDGPPPAIEKKKAKKQKIPGELWYIGSQHEWEGLDWHEWGRRRRRVPGSITWGESCHKAAPQAKEGIPKVIRWSRLAGRYCSK